MHPLRLIILIGLFYLLFKLLTGGRRKKNPAAPAADSGPAPPLAAHDVLVEDPVCHTYVPRGQALSLRQGDQTIYFCSDRCRKTFLTQQGDDG